jgi:hypothetical protein
MCCACFRVFKLLLRPDHTLFSPDAVFESSSGRQLRFDLGKVYVGALEGKSSVMMPFEPWAQNRTVDDRASISGRNRDLSLHNTTLGLTRSAVEAIL